MKYLFIFVTVHIQNRINKKRAHGYAPFQSFAFRFTPVRTRCHLHRQRCFEGSGRHVHLAFQGFRGTEEITRKQCGRSYNKDYLDYVCVYEQGIRLRPGYVTKVLILSVGSNPSNVLKIIKKQRKWSPLSS